MSKRTLVFNDVEVNKKDFYASKQAILLNLVNTNNIVISYRVKQNNELSHSQPIYDDKYIKTKVKTFNNSINTLFSGDEIPKVRIRYVCISAIRIDSVLRRAKKNYAQI